MEEKGRGRERVMGGLLKLARWGLNLHKRPHSACGHWPHQSQSKSDLETLLQPNRCLYKCVGGRGGRGGGVTLSTSDDAFLAVNGLAVGLRHQLATSLISQNTVNHPYCLSYLRSLSVCAHSVVKFALVMCTAIWQCTMSLAFK